MDRILVGLDGSPRSPGVLDAAAELARRTGGKLILFRAVGVPHEIPVEAYTMTPAALADLLQREAQRLGRGEAALGGRVFPGAQRGPAEQLQHQEGQALRVLLHVEHLHHVRAADARHHPRLLQEALDQRREAREPRVEELERHRDAEALVGRDRPGWRVLEVIELNDESGTSFEIAIEKAGERRACRYLANHGSLLMRGSR